MFNNFQSQVVNIEISSKTSQAKALFNFPPLRHTSTILTAKKSPVTRVHLPVCKSYNTGVCTHSEGQSSIQKAEKYQKYDVPHFSSTPGAKLKCNIQIGTLDNKSIQLLKGETAKALRLSLRKFAVYEQDFIWELPVM